MDKLLGCNLLRIFGVDPDLWAWRKAVGPGEAARVLADLESERFGIHVGYEREVLWTLNQPRAIFATKDPNFALSCLRVAAQPLESICVISPPDRLDAWATVADARVEAVPYWDARWSIGAEWAVIDQAHRAPARAMEQLVRERRRAHLITNEKMIGEREALWQMLQILGLTGLWDLKRYFKSAGGGEIVDKLAPYWISL